MSPQVNLFLSGMGIGMFLLGVSAWAIRRWRDAKELREGRLERLEKWSYENERGLARLTDRVRVLEQPKEGRKDAAV